MKYPSLLSGAELLSDLAAYDSIIDVRSEAEFALDHIPGAINCPVLNNDERIRVGTLYKQTSAFDAKKIGAALVAKNIAEHLQNTFLEKPRNWRPLVYCWRGGNRSGSLAHILAKIGWPAMQLEGGYREYRQEVIKQLDVLASQLQFAVICGTTGSGKSRLLTTLAKAGAQVLDLENLAAHRGSVLGGLPDEEQPSQKLFESRIWNVLRHCTANQIILVESESKKIGNLRVPELLMQKIRSSTCIRLTLDTSERVKLLLEDYPHLSRDTEQLMALLSHLTPLHGHTKMREWQLLAQTNDISTLVESLLVEHYDPAYLKSIERNFENYAKGAVVSMPDITAASFEQAAHQIMQQFDLALATN
jgi:tRNA 2-selenouridine synthase